MEPAPPRGPEAPSATTKVEVDRERRFLGGPQARLRELARVVRIGREFLRGFRTFHFVGPCVTVFGSARFGEGHWAYEKAREVGAGLARAGFTVMTGAGPGVMEGASRGAKEAGGKTVGCNILLPQEQAANPYVDQVVTFKHFYVRKVMLAKYSYAFLCLPGGLGTLDEAFEILTLIQTEKIREFPVVFVGTRYYAPLLAMLEHLVGEGAVDRADLDRVFVTDSPEEAVARVRDVAAREYARTAGPRMRRRWFLGERP